MGLDYERTRAGLQDELDVLGRTRQRLLDQLAPIDERIAAISCAMEALQRAFSGTSHAIIARTTSELDSDGEKSTVSETVETEKKFDITGNIREILGTGKKALAMDIRDALVTRGWNLEESRYKNPMAMVARDSGTGLLGVARSLLSVTPTATRNCFLINGPPRSKTHVGNKSGRR